MQTTTDRSGRLRRELGAAHSYAMLIGMLVGAGIFRVTSDASKATGASVVLGYVVLAPIVLAAAVPYAVFQSTSMTRGSGGDYAHIRAVFGNGAATFLAGWLKLISYIGALAFLVLVLADYSLEAATQLGSVIDVDAWRRPLATVALIGFGGIHALGVRWFGHVQLVMCALLGVAILSLVVPGVFAIEVENYEPFFTAGLPGFLAALPPLFFAYAGFESISHTAGEVKDAAQRLPSVYLRGVLATTVIFVAMSVVAFGTLDGAAIAASRAPMADAASRFLGSGGVAIVAFGGVFAAATSANATMAVPARLGRTMARDGYLPEILGRVHVVRGTPVPGLVVTVLLAGALLWTGQVGFVLTIAVLALLGVYLLHSAAMLALPRRNPELRAEVRAGLPWRVCVAAAWFASAALGALIVTAVVGDLRAIVSADPLARMGRAELTALELAVLWSALGGIVFLRARRRRIA